MAHVRTRTIPARIDPETGKVKRKEQKRYDVQWRPTPGGKTKEKTFQRRDDADNFLRQLIADSVAGITFAPSRGRATLKEVAADWLKSDPSKRSASVLRDRSILRTHIEPALGDRQIGSINQADVQRLVNGWAVKQKASTVGRQFSCIRAVFSYAVADGRIARNPCLGVRLPRVRLVDRPHLTAAHLQRLAEALPAAGAAMMWLGAVLGLRWSEAAGLRAQNVDLDSGVVSVVEQLGRDGTLGPPKSHAGRRRLAAPDWLIEVLRPLLVDLEPADLIFITSEGTPLSYTNWRRRVWVPATKKAKLAGVRFHDLRSLAATALVAAGVDVKTAQTRLGHSSPSVTLGLYARATQEADRLAADAVGDLFRPKG